MKTVFYELNCAINVLLQQPVGLFKRFNEQLTWEILIKSYQLICVIVGLHVL